MFCIRGRISLTNLFAPVHTILPELNIKAVVLGSLILIITAANLCEKGKKE